MNALHYRFYNQDDLERIISLLKEFKLPYTDIIIAGTEFIICSDENNIVGCIGIEKYDKDGLLRCLVVDKNYRNQGIANQLVNRLLAYCRQHGMEDIHLLTATAEKYFQTKGFVTKNRDEAPKSIQDSTEYSLMCPSTSVYMTMRQISKKTIHYTNEVKNFQIDEATGSNYWAIKGEKLMFTYFEIPPNKTFEQHTHESEQITYILRGKMFFQIKDDIFCVSEGDCIVIPSNIPHKVWTLENPAIAVDAWTPINKKYE